MWNKLAEMMQDPSYKRLGLALVLSAFLHALLFGGFSFALPNLKKDLHTIEAHIQMPKQVAKQLEATKPEEKVVPEEKPALEPKPEAPAEPDPIPEPIAEAPSVIAETPPALKPEPQVTAEPQNSEPAPPQEEPQPVDAGLVINENAYQYVETDFDVQIKIDGTDFKAKASIVYNLGIENQYNLKFLTEPKGFLALGASELLQISQGALTKTGLRPASYLYQYGNKADKTRTADFDWSSKKINFTTVKGSKTEDLPEGSQDLLSFMYQFMYVAPLQHMAINITNGKRLTTYDYTFEGEENINSELGELKTIHIQHSAGDTDDRTDLWLAIDYQHVPVKIRRVEKNGDVFEYTAIRLITNRPTVNN